MMRRRSVLVLGIIVIVFTWQCSHYDQLQNRGKESAAGSDESHNFGQDCMTCHNDNGTEAVWEGGWWNIAGSLYDSDGEGPFTDAVIELWSEPERQGTLYYSLEVDALGNFYTEKIINYNGTCFPVVVNANGEYKAMERAFHGGGCNSCHGVSEEVIEAP